MFVANSRTPNTGLRSVHGAISRWNPQAPREESIALQKINLLFVRLINNEAGQDLVEYALLAGFVAVAAGAILPDVSEDISTIFSKMGSVVGAAARGNT